MRPEYGKKQNRIRRESEQNERESLSVPGCGPAGSLCACAGRTCLFFLENAVDRAELSLYITY